MSTRNCSLTAQEQNKTIENDGCHTHTEYMLTDYSQHRRKIKLRYRNVLRCWHLRGWMGPWGTRGAWDKEFIHTWLPETQTTLGDLIAGIGRPHYLNKSYTTECYRGNILPLAEFRGQGPCISLGWGINGLGLPQVQQVNSHFIPTRIDLHIHTRRMTVSVEVLHGHTREHTTYVHTGTYTHIHVHRHAHAGSSSIIAEIIDERHL